MWNSTKKRNVAQQITRRKAKSQGLNGTEEGRVGVGDRARSHFLLSNSQLLLNPAHLFWQFQWWSECTYPVVYAWEETLLSPPKNKWMCVVCFRGSLRWQSFYLESFWLTLELPVNWTTMINYNKYNVFCFFNKFKICLFAHGRKQIPLETNNFY